MVCSLGEDARTPAPADLACWVEFNTWCQAGSTLFSVESTDMPSLSGPVIRDLSRAECEAILGRHDVGRIVYASGARVDIEPFGDRASSIFVWPISSSS